VKKNLLPIEAIAAKLDLPEDLYEKRSPVSGKLSLELLNDARFNRGGKLIPGDGNNTDGFGRGQDSHIDRTGAGAGSDW
jgi:hypothetical protein